MAEQNKIVLAAGGLVLAAGAASLVYHHLGKGNSSDDSDRQAQAHLSIVVFLDDGEDAAQSCRGCTIRHPRGGTITDLIASVGAMFAIDTPRWVVGSGLCG